jgi:hypothetical protein
MPDRTAAARVKRWRARKRGENVPFHKSGRAPRPRQDGFLDLGFIARQLQHLRHDTTALQPEFSQLDDHFRKLARRLDDNHRRLDEILRLVSAALPAPALPTSDTPDIHEGLRAYLANPPQQPQPDKVARGSSEDLPRLDIKDFNVRMSPRTKF